MRSCVVALVIFLSVPLNAQHLLRDGNNIAGFESGMFHRGILGASYHRLLLNQRHIILTAGAGAGIGGVPFGNGINQFYYLANTLGFGGETNKRERYFITLGFDVKYLNYNNSGFDEPTGNYVPIHRAGTGIMPHWGITIIDHKLFLQMRQGPLFFMNGLTMKSYTWGVGLTAGVLF